MLPQDEIIKCRLVSQSWRHEIDQWYHFHLTLNDGNGRLKWERVLQLSVTSIEIRHFLSPPFHVPGTSFFKFPSLVRSIRMSSSDVHPLNLFYLLSDCCATLVELNLRLRPSLFKAFSIPLSKFNFIQLRKLEIIVDMNPSSPSELMTRTRQDPVPLIDLMMNPLRSLEQLKLVLSLVGSKVVSECTSAVLSCLAFHSNTLRSFDFELMQGPHGFPSSLQEPQPDLYPDSKSTQLVQMSSLESLRIITTSSVGANYWIQLLLQQKQLKFLETNIRQISVPTFKEVIRQNTSHLHMVDISDLDIWSRDGEVRPFDISPFLECDSLFKIILDRHVDMSRLRRRFDCAELVNLHLLPPNLKECSLNYFNVLSEELILLCQGNGRGLKSITMTQCGNSGPFGVTGSVLHEFIALTDIEFLEISTINSSDPGEQEKLNLILSAYGYPDGHDYFQISKLYH